MRKKLFFLSLVLLSIAAVAQKDNDFPVKVKNPKLDDLINKLWNDLPSDCSVPSYAVVDGGEPTCAGLALKHFKAIINNSKMKDAFVQAIKAEFKLLKLIPAGKVAGTILDVADLTAKALTAKSPEELETELAKYGFGKVVGDDVLKKLKKISGVPDDEFTADVFTNVTKYYYKKLIDEAKKALLPKKESYSDHGTTKDCEDNWSFSIEPYDGDDPRAIGKVVFSANGDCHCKLACVPDGPAPHLGEWSVHGEMLLVIDKAEVVSDKVFWSALQLTLKAERPSYHIQAACDNCPQSTNFYKRSNELYAVASTIFEDSYLRFNTFGADVAFTHPFTDKLGVTVDGGVHLGSNNGTDYTKLQLMAGVSLLAKGDEEKVSVSPHLLAGVGDIHSSFKLSNSSFTSNSAGFVVAAGADATYPLTNSINLALRGDYNPGFFSGGIKHNFRLGIGVMLRPGH